jgi:hypothetical protein
VTVADHVKEARADVEGLTLTDRDCVGVAVADQV